MTRFRRWLYRYNPFMWFYQVWDVKQQKWCLGRMNFLKAFATQVFATAYNGELLRANGIENFSIVSRKNIIFEETS